MASFEGAELQFIDPQQGDHIIKLHMIAYDRETPADQVSFLYRRRCEDL